ncbi:unnamed protein product [Mycena citricolor]|uniref:Peptidase A1 domain-containing protein n=1 Tax=Mycena citricolor TaxID=2018698 RepID=A0AAD2Q722_9AGAR|nr:unnamed protein product [Mycena citricolor]CAK5281142.1 unnamed protein product [Mycena citricolor]
MLALTLLPAILLALRVSAGPVVVDENIVSLPIARRINATTVVDIKQADYARIANFKAGKSKRVSEPVSNQLVSYIASVGVGSPATSYDLIVDTGSSNTWVGAGKNYVKTSTSTRTGRSVSVSYGSGQFSGEEYTDRVTLARGLVINKQSIGGATSASGFNNVDGILGIGPVDLTQGTLGNSNSEIPTVVDNLFSAGTISSDVIGISFEPTTSSVDNNGAISFGGPDSSKYTGSISYTPVTSVSPAGEYWGIEQSITYGTTSLMSRTAGIVDTGTTLIYLPTSAYNKYQRATGAVADNATGLLRITSAQYSSLKNLNFLIGGTTHSLTPNGQIWPRSLNSAIGGTSGRIYLVVGDNGPSGSGLDFINGYAFLERFYSVFDTGNNRVGFASTSFTSATTN